MAYTPNLVAKIRIIISRPIFWVIILSILNLFYLKSISDRIGRDNPERQKALREVQNKNPELATGLYSTIDRNGSGNVDCMDKADINSLESDISDIKTLLEGRTLFPR